jgi:hypothetical protein
MGRVSNLHSTVIAFSTAESNASSFIPQALCLINAETAYVDFQVSGSATPRLRPMPISSRNPCKPDSYYSPYTSFFRQNEVVSAGAMLMATHSNVVVTSHIWTTSPAATERRPRGRPHWPAADSFRMHHLGTIAKLRRTRMSCYQTNCSS